MPLLLTGAGPPLGGAGWTPDELDSLISAVIPSATGFWQDAGKTTPADADGELVRVATSPFTDALDWVATADAARLSLETDGSKWWLESTGQASGFNLLGPAEVGLTANCTIAFRASHESDENNSRIIQAGDQNRVISLRRSGACVFSGGVIINGPLVADSDPHTVVLSKSGGDWSVWLDGVAQSVSAVANDWGRVAIGATSQNEAWDGRLYGVVVCDEALSTDDRVLLETYLEGLSP